MKGLSFFKAAIRDRMVGAVVPSSRYTMDRVLEEVGPECEYAVEYGPGDGVSTRAILAQLPAHGRMVAIERNPHFLPDLRAIGDPRLRIVQGDVCFVTQRLQDLGLPRIDAVISSIPFSFLPPESREFVVRRTFHALAPGGRFIVFQYSPLMFRYLKNYFSSVRVRFEPRNIPPNFIMVGEK